MSIFSIEVNHQLYILENDSLFVRPRRRRHRSRCPSFIVTSSSPMQSLTQNDNAQRPVWCLVSL